MSHPTLGIDEIFFAAMERESAEARAAYLDEVCASDPDLRRRVERLLDAQPKVGSFMDAPAVGETLTLGPPGAVEGRGTVSARTNCWRSSAKGAWASSTWPSRPSPCAARWR